MTLQALVAHSHRRVEEARRRVPLQALRERVADCQPVPASLPQALCAAGVSVIAEVKRASPSRGVLNEALDPAALACLYAEAGARAISVLTEPACFQGSLEDLILAGEALHARALVRPLLRKDFIVDAYQLLEARLAGASAVLLIAAALTEPALALLYEQALALGLTPLVEVHEAGELDAVCALRPAVVGINNRDLRTLSVDLATTARLRNALPPGCLVVSESGIREPEQVRRLAALGVDGVLVGEALVTATDPAARLRELVGAGR